MIVVSKFILSNFHNFCWTVSHCSIEILYRVFYKMSNYLILKTLLRCPLWVCRCLYLIWTKNNIFTSLLFWIRQKFVVFLDIPSITVQNPHLVWKLHSNFLVKYWKNIFISMPISVSLCHQYYDISVTMLS